MTTDDDSTSVTFTNEDPENTDANPMTVTGKITPKDPTKSPTDDDVTVTVTIFPEDGSTPIVVPEDAVSLTLISFYYMKKTFQQTSIDTLPMLITLTKWLFSFLSGDN